MFVGSFVRSVASLQCVHSGVSRVQEGGLAWRRLRAVNNFYSYRLKQETFHLFYLTSNTHVTHSSRIRFYVFWSGISKNVKNIIQTRNTLDCDQSNYSSRIVFSHTPIEFGQTGISAIRSADPENPTVEPNMKWIGKTRRGYMAIWNFPNMGQMRRRSVDRSVLNIQGGPKNSKLSYFVHIFAKYWPIFTFFHQ